MAYTSDTALVAAIAPHARASSTTGVKKSVVTTSARSASSFQIAASSPVAVPTSSSGRVFGVRLRNTSTNRPGSSLHAHPAPWLYSVRRFAIAVDIGNKLVIGLLIRRSEAVRFVP